MCIKMCCDETCALATFFIQNKFRECDLQTVLHRHRKIFLSMGAQLNENKICVGGDVVLFIMCFSYITTNE